MTSNEKKAWEIRQGQLVANVINHDSGCDYESQPAEREPADIVLRSLSGLYPEVHAQVVSIPLNYRYRDDKGTIKKFKVALTSFLLNLGARHLLIGVIPSELGQLRGIPAREVKALAEIIFEQQSHGDKVLYYPDLEKRNSDLANFVHTVNISYHPEIISDIEVEVPSGGPVPRDEKWIVEGIAKKLGKYGGEKAVQNLALIIGVAGYVDQPQIDAFIKKYSQSELPFKEIWINTQFEGTHCLKRST